MTYAERDASLVGSVPAGFGEGWLPDDGIPTLCVCPPNDRAASQHMFVSMHEGTAAEALEDFDRWWETCKAGGGLVIHEGAHWLIEGGAG